MVAARVSRTSVIVRWRGAVTSAVTSSGHQLPSPDGSSSVEQLAQGGCGVCAKRACPPYLTPQHRLHLAEANSTGHRRTSSLRTSPPVRQLALRRYSFTHSQLCYYSPALLAAPSTASTDPLPAFHTGHSPIDSIASLHHHYTQATCAPPQCVSSIC